MNNFFKYPSGSDIDVAEIFTKDNLVSITGLIPTLGGFDELTVLNKDNNFNNEGSPTDKPDYFEIKFGNIAIAIDTYSSSSLIVLNRNTNIRRNKLTDKAGNNFYDFFLVTVENHQEINERLGTYYTNS